MREDDKEKWYRNFQIGTVFDYQTCEDMSKFDDFFEIIEDVKVANANTIADKFNKKIIQQDVDWKNPEFDYKKAYDEAGLKPEKYEKFIENYDRTWLDFYIKKKATNKAVVLQEDVDLSKYMCNKLFHSKCAKYFINIPTLYESWGQLEWYALLDDCPSKIKIDRLIVDYYNKTITLIDVKTLGDFSSNFEMYMNMYSYQIQAEWYYKVFKYGTNAKSNVNGIVHKIKKLLDEGFVINEDFIFIVVPKNESAVLDCFYRTNQEEPTEKIKLAMSMYTKCISEGLAPNKQNYVESLEKWYVN